MTPDVNVLVAAARNDHAHHAAANAWLATATRAAAAGQPLTLLPMVVAGFLRLLTNRRVFPEPTRIDVAVGYIDKLLALPGVRLATLGAEWVRLRRICVDGQLTDNAIPDAWIAASTLHVSEHLVTFDRGFRKLMPRSQLTILAA